MQILTGKYRGRKLASPKTDQPRPTLNRIRSAIFDIAQQFIYFPEACCIDLFAGTGAVGLEALSRGFKYTALIEKNPGLKKILHTNCSFLTKKEVNIFLQNAESWLAGSTWRKLKHQFVNGLIFVDPPYEIIKHRYLKELLLYIAPLENWILVIQTPTSFELDLTSWITLHKIKTYGRNRLHYYKL